MTYIIVPIRKTCPRNESESMDVGPHNICNTCTTGIFSSHTCAPACSVCAVSSRGVILCDALFIRNLWRYSFYWICAKKKAEGAQRVKNVSDENRCGDRDCLRQCKRKFMCRFIDCIRRWNLTRIRNYRLVTSRKHKITLWHSRI